VTAVRPASSPATAARLRATAAACALWALGATVAQAQFMTGLRVDKERNAQSQAITARELMEKVGFDQKLGAQLPLQASFRDEQGRTVALGDFFGQRPVILGLVYYRCPLLCTLIERATARGLKPLDFQPGSEFEVVFVSFDPADTPENAAAKKAETLAAYGRPQSAEHWHFLTGDPESIAALTGAVGFRYTPDGTGQFAHASGLVVATADGRAARYLYGADYAPRDLKLALVEAGQGKVGGPVEQAMLVCFQYNATLGKYTAATLSILRIGATVTLAAVVGFILFSLRRERRVRPLAAGGAA
jgi:protein SCO1/2